MAVKVHIPTPLRPYVAGQDEVEVNADGSVNAVLSQLVTDFSDIKKHLYNDQDELRKYVNIYVNDEDIRYQSGTDTQVKSGDSISIVPSIAGGAG